MAIINENFTLKNIGNYVRHSVSEVISNSDFISRTIGMNNSYEDIMFIVQSLGRMPVSLLGKDYPFIFDHVRRNYMQGTYVINNEYNCPKFTFYKEKPTVRFANPYDDPQFLIDKWMPDFRFEDTLAQDINLYYSESNDGEVNNKKIDTKTDIDSANPGVAHGGVFSYGPNLSTCDLIKKTNDNFNYGKYRTLIARFHTNSEDSRSQKNPTQTANTIKYGMSHGRNLLKVTPTVENGYNNPYCRVWTYHHQYNQIDRAIRPFGDVYSADELERLEKTGDYNIIGFRRDAYDDGFGNNFDGASKRLDKYGVLNYKNGMVNIAPTAKIKDYFEHKTDFENDKAISIKKCMFSIENLAWKDTNNQKYDEYEEIGLSPEQKGPLGGRIMWFPPYDLTFNETAKAYWNENQFIGRGEKIYTYTNSERTGHISFTLVIDHPSILDYWTGHKRNGGKNQGIALADGNSGGVDNINNQENTLLRFFAGCDILTAKPQMYKTRTYNPEQPKEPTPPEPEEPTPPPAEVAEPVPGKMYAILYYPNNYSGKDDDPEFAIDYLMYGIGTQKRVRHLSINDLISGNGKYRVEDIQPKINDQNAKGYEVGTEGISLVTWPEISAITKYGVVEEGVSEYIKESYTYNGLNIMPAKQIGSTAYKGKDSTKFDSEWKYKRWFYRVDNSTSNQRLTGKPGNYIDGKSYGLNSTGYSWVKSNVTSFNLTDEDELVGFTDIYVAVHPEANLPCNRENADKIRKIMKGEDGYKVKKLTFKGHNSSHGRYKNNNKTSSENEAVNVSRNADLSSNRAQTFKMWMAKVGFPMAAEADATKTLSETTQVVNHKLDSVDNEYIKAWRSASVIIEYEKTEVADAATIEEIKIQEKTNAEGAVTGYQTDEETQEPLAKTVRTEIPNKETSDKASKIKFIPPSTDNILEYSKDYNRKLELQEQAIREGKPDDAYTNPNSWDYMLNEKFTVSKEKPVQRYDNEGEFFEVLERDAPFLHNLITDKIKYFDPAYHAISPEGFNARLTFLHQCTRQGSTVEASAFESSTAYNLSFGRPPVCVLRLGDFFNTKVVFTDLTINYEAPVQWDLNPEGIGVMPMFAKIDLSFNFIGGSDLSGPIARLQNAVSFNYYANTSVYDNRAEMVEYEPNGSGKETKFKGFRYPLRHGVASADAATTTEFAGRTSNLPQGVSGEVSKYQVPYDGDD